MPAGGFLSLGDGGASLLTSPPTSMTISEPAGTPDASPTSSPLAGTGDPTTLEPSAAGTVYILPSPSPTAAASSESTMAGPGSVDLEGATGIDPSPTPIIVTINGKISTEPATQPVIAAEQTPVPIVTVVNGKTFTEITSRSNVVANETPPPVLIVVNGKTLTETPSPSLASASRYLATGGHVEGSISSATLTAANGIATIITLVDGDESLTETLISYSAPPSGYPTAGRYVLPPITASDISNISNFLSTDRLFLCLRLINFDIQVNFTNNSCNTAHVDNCQLN
jgi:hypothetical protein